MVRYILPKLPYGYDELEPYIDKETMQIHHQKHHQAYVDGLNKSLEQIGGEAHPQYISSILSDLGSIPESAKNAVNFFGGGYENHKLFWETMSPNSDPAPGGKLEDAIDVYFNGFDSFKEQFTKQSLSIQGSGWCWLVFNPTYNRTEIITTANQDSPWTLRKIPLLGLDVWEHAYYLKHQNRRNDYVESWWNVINWDFVSNRFSELAQ
ncbi:superoxide dismutase [Nitrosopumilus sp. K4]|uniref:superoxide dismutase n=1 Tax=Nitrosopumilus sp. K4 TaxID=2795383 RepID=UPI001BA9104F|nr:superoxide dismutase [Nitrosopumilus sp. K4]QUC65300.1 superoxide dismutase [Nitrosopumilus sp. K4]